MKDLVDEMGTGFLLLEKWNEEMEELFKEEYITSQDWDEEKEQDDENNQ